MLRSFTRSFAAVIKPSEPVVAVNGFVKNVDLNLVDSSKCWKSAAHKELTVLYARRELVNKLYQRFGYRKTMETRLIGRPEIQLLCKVWATYFVDRYPNRWHEFLTVNYIPRDIMNTVEWMRLTSPDTKPELKWLIGRISLPVSEDHVPYPHYPKFLSELEYPKWPYNPYEAEWMTEHYGLLKYPFLRRGKRDRSRGGFTGLPSYETEVTYRPKPEPLV